MKTATKAMAVVAVALLAMGAEAAPKRGKTQLQMSGQLNLNTATQAQLDQLPGVGDKAAKRIIEHRAKTPFAKAEDLMKVKGFGKKKFEKLKSSLGVTGGNTLVVRRVPKADGLGATQAAGHETQGRAPPARR